MHVAMAFASSPHALQEVSGIMLAFSAGLILIA
jgi:hypothetical protein